MYQKENTGCKLKALARLVGINLSALAGLLAMPSPVWLFYGQAEAITKPIPSEKKKSRFGVFGRVSVIF